jgi:oxygen-independent coproporphyrinogen-3 oxidase
MHDPSTVLATRPAALQHEEPIRHLYAHIPFCPAKCEYCAFVTHIGSTKLVAPYVAALASEALRRGTEVLAGPLETVYLGGGTPSMLLPEQIDFLLGSFQRVFGLAADAEISMEAHPATVSAGSLAGYREAGVNRISFGIESLSPVELRALGRAGGSRNAEACIALARAAGIASIAVDLMYGIPDQTVETWQGTLYRTLEREPDHLSLYPLSIEPKTPFGLRDRQLHLALPSEDTVVEMYLLACDMLRHAGYVHYEVGSWARPGHQCRHNLAYWRNQTYLGLGVGAHGYAPGRRTVNVSQTARYIRLIEAGVDPVSETVEIGSLTRAREGCMLQLRLLEEGLEFELARTEYGVNVLEEFGGEIETLADLGLLRRTDRAISLTEAAIPVANEVWERLIP